VLVLCGGSNDATAIASLAHGAHIVVGTPGRISIICRARPCRSTH